MDLEENSTVCEAYYKDSNFSSTIREWNIDPTENISLVVIEGYLGLIISTLGSIGNLLTILILVCSKIKRSSLTCLLGGLAICDLVVTVSGIFVYSLTAISDFYPETETWSDYRKSLAARLMVIFYPLLYTGNKNNRIILTCILYKSKELFSILLFFNCMSHVTF